MKNFLGIICLWLLFTGSVYAGEGDTPLRINLSSSGGSAGTIITVTGQGAELNNTVRVVLSDQAAPPSKELAMVEFSANSDGSFAVSLAIPDNLADGSYYVRAEQIKTGNVRPFYYYHRFYVGAVDQAGLLPGTGNAKNVPSSTSPEGGIVGLTLLLVFGLFIKGCQTMLCSR